MPRILTPPTSAHLELRDVMLHISLCRQKHGSVGVENAGSWLTRNQSLKLTVHYRAGETVGELECKAWRHIPNERDEEPPVALMKGYRMIDARNNKHR